MYGLRPGLVYSNPTTSRFSGSFGHRARQTGVDLYLHVMFQRVIAAGPSDPLAGEVTEDIGQFIGIQRRRSVHDMEVQMRGGGIAGVAE
jgi:hypothetical protein